MKTTVILVLALAFSCLGFTSGFLIPASLNVERWMSHMDDCEGVSMFLSNTPSYRRDANPFGYVLNVYNPRGYKHDEF